MSIPKQDERTPVDAEEEQFIRLCRALGFHPGLTEAADVFDAAVKAVNAYTSTEALRSALTNLLAATDPYRDGRGTDQELDAREAAVIALNRVSGSPAPSTEGLRECERVLRAIMDDPRGCGIDPEHRRQARTALAEEQSGIRKNFSEKMQQVSEIGERPENVNATAREPKDRAGVTAPSEVDAK